MMMGEVRDTFEKMSVLLLIIILTLFGFSTYLQQGSGGGTVTVTVTAPVINSIAPSNPTASSSQQRIDVYGNNFAYGATVGLWNPNGELVPNNAYFDSSTHIYFYAVLSMGGNWKIQIINPDGQKSNIYTFYVNPPTCHLSITSLTPSTITANTAPYDATLYLEGSCFLNVIQVIFQWSGAVSGSATWNKGDSNWNTKVSISSDTSMTLRPRVVETNPTWSGTVYWKVTLKDASGATASASFTVSYTPQLTRPQLQKTFSVTVAPGGSAEDTIVIYNPNNVKITVKSFTITDYGGFKGSVTVLTSLPFDISAYSSGEIRVRITANSDCPAGTFTIKYKITGDPNNWEVLGD